MVSRKGLLGRGIADRWVGLLRRHRVESDVTAGALEAPRTATNRPPEATGKGLR